MKRPPRVPATPQTVQGRFPTQRPGSRDPLIIQVGGQFNTLRPGGIVGGIAEFELDGSKRLYYIAGADTRHRGIHKTSLSWRWAIWHWLTGNGWLRHMFTPDIVTVLRLWPWRPSPLPRRLPA